MPVKHTLLNPALLGGTHIFQDTVIRRPSTERRGWIGFHGTTTTHVSRIENEGLKAHKVLDLTEVAILCEVGWELIDNVDDREGFSGRLKEAEAFSNRTVVNFFSVSALALEHTRTRGGQGKQWVLKPIVQEILRNPRFNNAHRRWTAVERIRQQLDAEVDGSPVVYAVYLRGLKHMWYYHVHAAIQAAGPIEKWRIVARLDAPEFTDYRPQMERDRKIESAKLAGPRSQHFTSILPSEPPSQ